MLLHSIPFDGVRWVRSGAFLVFGESLRLGSARGAPRQLADFYGFLYVLGVEEEKVYIAKLVDVNCVLGFFTYEQALQAAKGVHIFLSMRSGVGEKIVELVRDWYGVEPLTIDISGLLHFASIVTALPSEGALDIDGLRVTFTVRRSGAAIITIHEASGAGEMYASETMVELRDAPIFVEYDGAGGRAHAMITPAKPYINVMDQHPVVYTADRITLVKCAERGKGVEISSQDPRLLEKLNTVALVLTLLTPA